jgi:hypothetical protein
MRKLITIVVTIAITTMSYAQDSTILRAKAQQSCTRDDGFKDWYCIDFKYEGATFILKNEVFYVTDDHSKAKYILKEKGDVKQHNGFSRIVFQNVIDKDGKRCAITIITYTNGNKIIYIAYEKNK